ncbi:FAD/NAD(P)-binding protein [Streptantibioticus rubrisoli]|uniref:FAD/NAD(P)-binding protein n=1 Tax=Streptantibioticus rubrisoli TaxID=1387313 RepID=A0ABT1P7Z7_9ACTN|nr:FAD/NAD(P)-binding protein [Streptantibioticus rubrisoli]MCQ4041496.1 FAD/NAD(P)-binding protein [Streptantibioticus rubrisoli]
MRVAVIGGGAAAVSLLDSMLRTVDDGRTRWDITLYEGAPDLATGRAYRPDLDCALVNREAGYMSIRCHERDHFLRWLRAEPRYRHTQHAALPVDAFVPRRIYGEYLVSQLARCRGEAERRGWTVSVVREFALEAKASDSEILIRTADGVRYADRLVLCLGAGSPADPYRLVGAPGFHPDPYPLRTVLPRIGQDARVLVLGTGLSGVDVALGLLRTGHRGPVTMASRHGVLPGVRAVQRAYQLRRLTPRTVGRRVAEHGSLRLRDFLDLLRAELTEAGADIAEATARRAAHEWLRADLARLDDNPYQTIATSALHQVRESVWSGFGDADRRRFLRRVHPYAKPLFNPMPPSTARALLAAMDSGQLEVRSDLTAVVPATGGGFWLDSGRGRRRVDGVVDATRSGLATTGTKAEPLLESLVNSGLAMRNPYGGLRVDTATNALHSPVPGEVTRCYALGDITSGDLFYAGSMYMINVRADVISRALADSASHDE